MHCPSCDHANRDDRRFCAKCGSRLGIVCAACGVANGADESFCGGCGGALATSTTSAATNGDTASHRSDGERRQLTVLFCDLVGSSEMAGRLDPEDWGRIAARYQRVASEAAADLGGHVAKFLGDGIVVYFGWPHAYDDAAERGVRAGLAILDALAEVNRNLAEEGAPPLAARIGIDTGLVVVGEGGGADAEVFGETPNVAARVQTLAEPDTVLITAMTHRLVAGLFIVEDRGAQSLKGVATPITVFRVRRPSGARRRLDVAATTGLTPFVGREDEREILEERWRRARDGAGQLMMITGEAGIGKSRLVKAFRATLATEPHTWVECFGSPYHQNTPFFPVVEMLQQGLAWRGDESSDDRLAALTFALQRIDLPLAETLPLIARLLGLPLPAEYPPLPQSPEGARRKLLASLTAWLRSAARVQPLVLVVEDLHWVDPSTLALLTLFGEQSADAPILLLYTARPEFRPPWDSRVHHGQLTLNRLGRQHVQEMIRTVAADAALPRATVATVAARSDGVPLFVEELTRLVVDGDGRSNGREIPVTLQDSLMARLDRLGSAKEIAQIGAVIGREFSHALLASVAASPDDVLQRELVRLADADLVHARGTAPDVTYVFKHALVRDTAYESLLKSRRRELHGSIARALGTHFPAIVESQPELLAHHYTESSAVADALPHWRRAGQLALERSAHAEAVNHLERGLALLGTLPAGRDRTAMELAFRMPLGIGLIASTGYASDAVADNLTRARACCHELGSVPELVLFGLWFFNLVRADREATLDLATQLLTLAEQTRDTTQLLLANSAMASTMHFHGNPLVSRQHATRALALHDPERHRSLILGTGLDPAVSSHFYNAANLWQLGYPDQALAQVGEALARARTAVHALALAGTLSFGATIRLWRGELDDAEALAEELVAVSREQGLPVWLGFALAERGQAMVQRGEASAGLQQIEEGIAIYRATGALLNVQGLLHSRAEACLALGNVVEGMNAVEEAIALAERGIDRVFEPDVRRLRAELRLLAGDAAGAERSFLEAIAVARERESRGWELRAVNGLARLWGRNGKRHVARDMLGSLYASFTEGFDTADLRQARALLAELT